jgi:hypothetical protein
MATAKDKVDFQRRELKLRATHAFGHGFDGKHHHLNLEAFLRELERFIDAKIEESRGRP